MIKRICFITGTRADYGQLYKLMRYVDNEKSMELQVIATGMHLSSEFGMTYKQIEEDGIIINSKIEILLSSDTPTAISKSTGIGIISASEVFYKLKPDLIVVLGDRFEILSFCIAATFANVPIAHFHGGEITEALIDEPIRHSITKMSHIHFAATEEYRNRIIQMGELPSRVFNVGGMGVDRINNFKLLSKNNLESKINFTFSKKNLLVTYHPLTLEKPDVSIGEFKNLLTVLESQSDFNIIFTKPNADTHGRVLINMIDKFVDNFPDRSIAFKSLGDLKYLSSLKYVDAVVGNSSSGLTEAPTFKTATINIGDRQKGRIKAQSVIDCDAKISSINNAISMLSTREFQKKLLSVSNPYGNGGAAKVAYGILMKSDFKSLIKKKFYDIKMN